MRFFSRASVVGARQTALRSSAIASKAYGLCVRRRRRVVRRDLRLDFGDARERLVPARLEFSRHQPVGGIGGVILAERPIGRVARRFEIAQQSFADVVAPVAASASAAAEAAIAAGSTTRSKASSMASSTRSPPKAMQRGSP